MIIQTPGDDCFYGMFKNGYHEYFILIPKKEEWNYKQWVVTCWATGAQCCVKFVDLYDTNGHPIAYIDVMKKLYIPDREEKRRRRVRVTINLRRAIFNEHRNYLEERETKKGKT